MPLFPYHVAGEARDRPFACAYCGLVGPLSMIGEHWIRQPDHAPGWKGCNP